MNNGHSSTNKLHSAALNTGHEQCSADLSGQVFRQAPCAFLVALTLPGRDWQSYHQCKGDATAVDSGSWLLDCSVNVAPA